MKLKFLTSLSKEKADYKEILEERLGLRKVRWYHVFYFIKSFKQMSKEIEVLRNLDPKKVEEQEDCKLIRPEKIDQLSYGAMVELQVLFQNPGDREIGELITMSIAICCYESHTKKEFDSDKDEFKRFVTHVGEQDLVHMLGLFNWIDREINASIEKWNKLFKRVEVHDQDWDNAGGSMMSNFDVLNTIKKTCSAFNVDYKGALQMSFGMVQANCLSDATRSFIQDKMRQNIEARMKAKQKSPT
jgi:hypothetical protein